MDKVFENTLPDKVLPLPVSIVLSAHLYIPLLVSVYHQVIAYHINHQDLMHCGLIIYHVLPLRSLSRCSGVNSIPCFFNQSAKSFSISGVHWASI